jgi:hypothetical protein
MFSTYINILYVRRYNYLSLHEPNSHQQNQKQHKVGYTFFHCLIILFSFQGLWANNGDALSRQYAGTNALKGDFTRTGERNLSGLMKDGMNSASRYYLNQFRDAYRQATIDLMTGQTVR